MGLWKAIEHGKEHRKPYRGSKAFDYSCHNHGSCPACLDNRMHSTKKRKQRGDEYIKEIQKQED